MTTQCPQEREILGQCPKSHLIGEWFDLVMMAVG